MGVDEGPTPLFVSALLGKESAIGGIATSHLRPKSTPSLESWWKWMALVPWFPLP